MQTDNSLSITGNSSTNNDAVNKTDTTKKTVIKINDEYKQLISQLTSVEYDTLKKSISESNGNVVPIILNKQGVILDGYHRYRACKELGIDPKIEIKEFSDPIDEKEFIIIINLNRRQLNFFQIAELGVKLEEIEKEKAELRLSKAGKIGSDILWKASKSNDDDNSNGVGSNETTLSSPIEGEQEEKGKTTDIIAKKIGLSPTTYFRARKIISESPEEQKQRLREGKDKIDKIYKGLQKEKKKSEFLSTIKQPSNQLEELLPQNNNGTSESLNFNLHCGNLSEKGKEISSDSIDLIFTDSLYSSKNLNIYSELTLLANRVLKPGCSFVTSIGLHNLPQILEIARLNDLYFWWILAVKLNGNTSSFHQRKVNLKWKPLLWFVKGEKLSQSSLLVGLNEYIDDFIESKSPDKILHSWEQSILEVEHIIMKLTLENQTILDPLMDSGTTGLAAINLGRKFIGIENDQEKFAIAKKRLEENKL